VILTSLSIVCGNYFAKVFQGEINFLSPLLSHFEKMLFRLLKISPDQQMDWKEYTKNLLIFSVLGILILVIIQVTQQYLPLNPQKIKNVDFLLALNTAISFVTNTNWQSYSGETTLSYFVQMFGLAVQNFISAAVGISVLVVLIRAIVTRKGTLLGNFWTDLTKSVLYVLLPLSIIVALILVSQGVVQTFSTYVTAKTLEGAEQIIPLGPAASQIAIKQLGTNGGGFFGLTLHSHLRIQLHSQILFRFYQFY